MSTTLTEGQRVRLVRAVWLRGTVTGVSPDGTVRVRFNDGETRDVEPEDVEVIR